MQQKFSVSFGTVRPGQQRDLSDWGDGSASNVFAMPIRRSEFGVPAHTSKGTVYREPTNSTLGDAVAGRYLAFAG